MFHRQTQTDEYWETDWAITQDDLDFVNNLLLEEERPLPIDHLTLEVMRNRMQQEENKLHRMLAKGSVYKPANTYQSGETLVFPGLNFAIGNVDGIRPGSNPEYGQFEVIEVRFERPNRTREFAQGLTQPHPLNEQTDALLQGEAPRSVEELYRRHGKAVRKKLESALGQQDGLIQLFGLWFLKALVTEVGPGYLNIAEAILDIVGGGPLAPPQILKDLGLTEETRPELLEFSLNYALFKDERFDEVGPAGQVLWYLRRLEPAEVLHPPQRLRYASIPYNRDLLNLNLRKLEQDLDDEWSSSWEPAEEAGPAPFTLTFPHWQQGTIPLSSKIAPLFPTSYLAPRIRCTIIDKHSGQEMEAWVVWEGRFVHGLGNWYLENELPLGAYLHLSPGPEPGVAIIEYEERRSQREWIRVAVVEGNQLRFGMQKRAVAAAYDDMMMIGLDDPTGPDTIWLRAHEQHWSLAYMMVHIFPELARLSPQSTVHAKTLYSAVNIIQRCPPGPIFAELIRQPCFISMGENYWRFNPSLWSGD